VAELGSAAHAELLAALANPSQEDGVLASLERLPAPPREPILAYVRERSRLARELSHSAAVAAGGGEPAALLARSLRAHAERQAIRAVRAAGLLGEREAAGAAARGLASGSAAQRANALEALELLPPSDLIRPLVQVWEPGETVAGGWTLRSARALMEHEDAWIRECAAYAAAQFDGGAAMETLTTLPLMERIVFLGGVPLFSGFAPADLKQVAEVAREHLFPDGAVLARQGQRGEELYIVVSGAVRVLRGAEQIAVRERGEHVGEQAILTGAARNATLVAAGETRTLVIDRPHLESVLRERPETAVAVIRTLSARLTELL
jgi:hypothetical protein